ncbi:hypothetical protein BTO30_02965 [Domibacillus antri]|uniref:HNH nuclease domain-containing protein n=2 Tax=Domibacillus antri TaxID=1714264 RepID=A0A1Q8Q8N9_9BACI|nr:hypothetical protein BTO30_02965 [Domibacillus antri]
MREMKTKHCSRCDQTKRLKEFYNPGRHYCIACERQSAKWRMHSKANIAATAARNAAKKAAKFGVYSDLTADDVAYLFTISGGRCSYCNRLDRLTLEHLLPMSKGHPNTISNCTAVCARCNQEKKDGDFLDFLEVRLRHREADELMHQVASRRGVPYRNVLAEFVEEQRQWNNERIRKIMAGWAAEEATG